MRKNLKGCKKLARETLTGNFTVPVIGSIAVAAMSVVSSYISTALFSGRFRVRDHRRRSIQLYPFAGDLRFFRRTLPDLPEYFQKGSIFFWRSSVLFQPPARPCDRGILCAGTDQSGDITSTGVVFVHKRYGKYSGRADELGSDLYAADTSRVWAEPADSHAFHHELLYSVR